MPGTLVVSPIMGSLTHDTDTFFKMTPYVKIKIGTQEFKSAKSSSGGTKPQWQGQQHTFNISNEGVMTVDLWDYDTLSSDDYIGQGSFALSKYTNSNSQQNGNEQIPMTYKGKDCGTIMISIQWFPNAQQGGQQQPQQQFPQQQQQQFPQQQQQQFPQQQQQFPQQQQYPQQFPQQQQYPQQFPQQQQYPQQFPQQQQYPQQFPQQQQYPQQFPQQGYPQQFPQQYPQQQFPQQYPQQGYPQQQYPQQPQQPFYPQQQQYPQQFPQQQGGFVYQPFQPQQQTTFQVVGVDKKQLKNLAPQIFFQYDRDRSGTLDKNELYAAVCATFQMLNHPYPSPQYVNQVMWEYDKDGSMTINQKEFKKILKSICQLKKKKK